MSVLPPECQLSNNLKRSLRYPNVSITIDTEPLSLTLHIIDTLPTPPLPKY